MTRARPLRFLALLLGLWIGVRAFMLAMPGDPRPERSASAAPWPQPLPSGRPLPVTDGLSATAPAPSAPSNSLIREVPYKGAPLFRAGPAGGRFVLAMAAPSVAAVSPDGPPAAARNAGIPGAPIARTAAIGRAAAPDLPEARRSGSRWSGSAWLLVREGRGQAALAPGGTLGGSQVGGRLLYRLGGGFSLSGRVYAPLRRSAEAEVAAGIDWRPSARMPVRLLAERRQDVGGAGRSAFALTVYGGASGRLPGGLRGEAYAQAGVVGTRSRDLFIDAAARVSVPAGRVEAGASAWAAAQPGAARLDLGPHVSYRLPIRGANLRVQADWRFRIAGDAAPDSGPALTLAADF